MSYRRNAEDRMAKTASWHSLLHFTFVRDEKETLLDVQGRLLLLNIQIITKSTGETNCIGFASVDFVL